MILCKDFDTSNLIKDHNSWRDLFFLDKYKKIKKQWKPGRSAFECANFWCDFNNQEIIKNKLSKNFPKLNFKKASPEFKTKFDDYDNPRQHDLFIEAEFGKGKLFIGIEAKVDEPLGDVVSKSFINASAELIKNPNSKKVKRILELFNNFSSADLFWGLRYQLVHSIAGLISEAKRENISSVLFLIQTFKSYDNNKTQKNEDAINNLIYFLSKGSMTKMNNDEVYGPIQFDSGKYNNVNLYLCKMEFLKKSP
jgi:hypothetical protein